MNIAKTFLNLSKKPTILTSLLVATIIFIYSAFLKTVEWESEMIIAVQQSSSGKEEIVQSLNLLNATSNDNPLKLKTFLESNEGIKKIIKSSREVMGKNFIEPSKYDFIRLFDTDSDLLKSWITIELIEGSNMLRINSIGKTSNNARILNLIIINLSIEFFNNKARLNSTLNFANSSCALKILTEDKISTNLNLALIFDSLLSSDLSNQINSRELLIKTYEQYSKFCSENKSTDGSKSLTNLPSNLLESLDAVLKQQIIQDIYISSNQSAQNENIIEIIADPHLADEPNSKRSLILAFVGFMISMLSIISISGFLTIWRNQY